MKNDNFKQLGFLFLGLTLLFSGCQKTESNESKTYPEPAVGVSFTDSDFNKETIGGNITVQRAEDENNITSYVLYWGADSAKISKIATLPKTGSNLKSKLPYKNEIPEGATHILAVSVNENGESNKVRSVLIKDNFGIQYYENTPATFNAVALDSLDNVYVAGSMYKSANDCDSVTMKYTSQLKKKWGNFETVSAADMASDITYSADELDAVALAIVVDENNDGVYTAGKIQGTMSPSLGGMTPLLKVLYKALGPHPEFQKPVMKHLYDLMGQNTHYGMEDIFWNRHNSEYGYRSRPNLSGDMHQCTARSPIGLTNMEIQTKKEKTLNVITIDYPDDETYEEKLNEILTRILPHTYFQSKLERQNCWNGRPDKVSNSFLEAANQFGTAGSDEGKAMVLSKDKLYITGVLSWPGKSQTDAFLAIYDIKDTKLYHQRLGDAQKNDYGNTVAVDSQGDIYIGGHTSGALDGNHQGKMDSFIMKFSLKTMLSDPGACTEDGKCPEIRDITHESNRLSPDDAIWKIQLGSSEQEYGEVVAVDSSDNVYVAGNTGGDVCPEVAQEERKLPVEDVFIFKYSSEGAPLWCKQVGTVYKDLIQHMVVDSENNVYLLIETKGDLFDDNQNQVFTEMDLEDLDPRYGHSDIAIIKYSPSGEEIWKKQFGTSGDDFPKSMALDSQGNIYIAGQTKRIFEDDNKQNETQSAFIIKLTI